MPQITKAIGSRAFELIDLRIGEILADELSSQAALIPDANIAAPVYVERFVAVSATETPCVLVYLVRGDYGLKTPFSQDGEYTFNIDCYESSSTVGTERGDKTAMIKLQRLLGVCHGILSHQNYKTLGFTPPFIGHRSVENMGVQQPSETKDSKSVVMGRLSLKVRANNTNLDEDYPIIAGFETQVGLNETAFGYLWGDPQTPPPPIEGPGSVNINNSLGDFMANIGGATPAADYNTPDASVTLDGAALIDAPANATTDVKLVDTGDVTVAPVSIIGGVIKISTSGAAPSGICYFPPSYGGLKTAKSTYDADWQRQAGAYDYTPPTHPVSFALKDTTSANPFTTLISNNFFGNLDVFTDQTGAQTYADNYAVDNSSRLGWITVTEVGQSWVNHLSNANGKSYAGHSDYRLPTLKEYETLADMNLFAAYNYPPFNLVLDSIALYTCELVRSNTAYIYMFRPNITGLTNQLVINIGRLVATDTSGLALLVRNHF